MALKVSKEEGSYASFRTFIVGLRKFWRVVFYFSCLCPVELTLFCTVASFKVPPTRDTREQQAESLILSKLDYCNELLFDIPKYKKQQLQKVQMQQLV